MVLLDTKGEFGLEIILLYRQSSSPHFIHLPWGAFWYTGNILENKEVVYVE
jgi:hypothetical protein